MKVKQPGGAEETTVALHTVVLDVGQ
jgi:hypothetical protein